MSGSRLALVADDQRLAHAISNHLKKNLGQVPEHVFRLDPLRTPPGLTGDNPRKFLCAPRDSVRNFLDRTFDGVVILATATPADGEPLFRLVQEVHLQQWKDCSFVLVEGEGAADTRELAALNEHHLLARLRAPDDLPRLAALVRDRLGRSCKAAPAPDDSPREVISRQLLAMTPSLLPMVEKIAIAATHDVTVLLTGETGTGKTHLARLMHECSDRRNEPFVAVPCGAQPANLVESAFFGHVKGAFTGADRPKDGKFKAAGKGTILLDEIDTLGLEQQAALLRVIETGEYEPVGSNATEYSRARIIVASNWNLEEAVERGRFRQDLFYRLNVMSFHLPPLRERVQDIGYLVRGMAARFALKFRKGLFDISPEALAAVESFPWQGNIRQLENVVQQAVLVSTGPELLPEHLPQPIREFHPARAESGVAQPEKFLEHNRALLEKNVIARALQSNGFSRARAANALGISRVTLYKKMKKYGLMKSPLRPTGE